MVVGQFEDFAVPTRGLDARFRGHDGRERFKQTALIVIPAQEARTLQSSRQRGWNSLSMAAPTNPRYPAGGPPVGKVLRSSFLCSRHDIK